MSFNVAGLIAERDELQKKLESAEAERDALKARINHKSVGTAARYPGDNEVAYLLHTKNDEEEAERDDMEVVKLYAAPIPSHDTQELIRDAVEEEIDNCARTARANWKYGPEPMEEAIRSRSTKEK